jgi:hypothetical protein
MDRQQHDREEARTGNMGLASCGVKCLNSSLVSHNNFSAQLTVLCIEISHECQAQNRSKQVVHLKLLNEVDSIRREYSYIPEESENSNSILYK